jgi:hypothetical protein
MAGCIGDVPVGLMLAGPNSVRSGRTQFPVVGASVKPV